MPFGRYTVLSDGGDAVGIEEFRCAPGPMGWRYFSQVERSDPTPHRETLDFAVNSDWRIARLRIDTGEHDILLEPSPAGATLTGYRDRTPIEIPYGADVHVDYFTPATNAITVRRLAGTAEIDVLYLEPVTLEQLRVRQRYELLGDEEVDTPVGRFAASRWRFTALDSGWSADLWVAGDIVVKYERLFELTWLDPGASGPQPVA